MLRAETTSGGTVFVRIKQANPAAIVVSAPLAPTSEVSDRAIDDRLFLQQMYSLGLASASDVVGMNGLGFAYSPDDTSDPNGFGFSRLAQLREIMVSNGDAAKSAWALEVGWLVATPDNLGPYEWMEVTEQQQADYLVRAYEKGFSEWPWLQAMFVWNLDVQCSWLKQHCKHFGIAPRSISGRADLTPRPAYYALKDMPKLPPTSAARLPLMVNSRR